MERLRRLRGLAWLFILGGGLLPGAVLAGLAKQEERLPDQRVEVSFGDTDDGAGRLDRSG